MIAVGRTMSFFRCIERVLMIALLAAFSCQTLPGLFAQESSSEHARAKAAQDAHDKRHHTTAKTVGGTAAGGALIGGVAGGGKGALIGGAAGAGAGVVADKVRKHKGVTKRERQDSDQPNR